MSRKLKAIYLILSLIIIGFYIIYKLKPVKEVMIAVNQMKFSGNHSTLQLFSNGNYTYTLKYWRIDSIKKNTGEYRLKNDTIYFSDPLPEIKTRKAIIKNNIVEFQWEYSQRLIITKNSLNIKSNINYLKHPDFALFTFTPAYHSNIFDKNSKPYDLKEKDILEIIKIFNTTGKDKNISKNYWKQCLAVITPKGEKEVWINCRCKAFTEPTNFQYSIAQTLDGGQCNMNLKINLTTHQYYDVRFNGM